MNKNTIKGLSAIELKLLSRLTYEGNKIYKLSEIKNYLPVDYKNVKNLITSLKEKKILISVKKGTYIFVPIEYVNKGIFVNELIIPSAFLTPVEYYIGYSTMYNFYNLYEQKFQTIYVLNKKYSKIREILGVTYKFVKVDENRLSGAFVKKFDNIDVSLATKEKTLIDLLYFNKPVGGLKKAINIFETEINRRELDLNFLIELAAGFPVIKIRKILGYLLEKKLNINPLKLKKLQTSIENTSLIAIEGDRKGHIDRKWGLIINDTFEN